MMGLVGLGVSLLIVFFTTSTFGDCRSKEITPCKGYRIWLKEAGFSMIVPANLKKSQVAPQEPSEVSESLFFRSKDGGFSISVILWRWKGHTLIDYRRVFSGVSPKKIKKAIKKTLGVVGEIDNPMTLKIKRCDAFSYEQRWNGTWYRRVEIFPHFFDYQISLVFRYDTSHAGEIDKILNSITVSSRKEMEREGKPQKR